ncbi:HAD-IIA family hydrolase [Pseudanabaena sp. FACHB-1998]|uniref:HAD-IIA family hydrolase n=1 Tax=Pseudanabaena sp. FACHB-1998 TaxID=2692858 RepID=UPI00168195AD|nr:HAD-IIA family hydrolase [Pseudanabaena sp. FACHB-1998]MBD2175659.1 HAD-IIA family hydrolase [Pseudanabaena sp. FACHB-1998]
MDYDQYLDEDTGLNIQDLLREKSCFVIDLDGVVYKGKQVIKGADEAITKFRQLDKKIVFLTNNSASSTDAILSKLNSLGVACDRQEILTAAQASASYIAQHQLDQNQGVLVIGTEALKAEVVSQGLKLAEPDDCGAVLVGLDPKFDYEAIAIALRALVRNVKLIICNRDANFPVEGDRLMPGCGAMVGAIESAIARNADVEIGKPNTIMLDIITQKLQIAYKDCLIIGDMLASDILMANKAKIPSIWITETSSYLDASSKSIRPSLCMPSLRALSKVI